MPTPAINVLLQGIIAGQAALSGFSRVRQDREQTRQEQDQLRKLTQSLGEVVRELDKFKVSLHPKAVKEFAESVAKAASHPLIAKEDREAIAEVQADYMAKVRNVAVAAQEVTAPRARVKAAVVEQAKAVWQQQKVEDDLRARIAESITRNQAARENAAEAHRQRADSVAEFKKSRQEQKDAYSFFEYRIRSKNWALDQDVSPQEWLARVAETQKFGRDPRFRDQATGQWRDESQVFQDSSANVRAARQAMAQSTHHYRQATRNAASVASNWQQYVDQGVAHVQVARQQARHAARRVARARVVSVAATKRARMAAHAARQAQRSAVSRVGAAAVRSASGRVVATRAASSLASGFVGAARGLTLFLGSLGTAATGITAAAVSAARSMRTFAEETNAGNRYLANFNGSIALGFTRLQMGDIRRTFQVSSFTERSTVALTESINHMRDNFLEFDANLRDLRNVMAKQSANFIGNFAKPFGQAIGQINRVAQAADQSNFLEKAGEGAIQLAIGPLLNAFKATVDVVKLTLDALGIAEKAIGPGAVLGPADQMAEQMMHMAVRNAAAHRKQNPFNARGLGDKALGVP